jgi:hypothetical protein
MSFAYGFLAGCVAANAVVAGTSGADGDRLPLGSRPSAR